MKKFETKDIKIDSPTKINLKKFDTNIQEIYSSKEDFQHKLAELIDQIDTEQSKMYADGLWGMLVIFQAMDAAGKDGTIKHVFSGVNPAGMAVHSFKRPSESELAHDYLWRHQLAMPNRGQITIFNRSYYEEVLVVKVHPEILTNYQKIPSELIDDQTFEHRYDDIVNYEKFASRNGFKIVKIFLNVSKKEQTKRLVGRIDNPDKNWKFDANDLKERAFWDDYQNAYEEAIGSTASKQAPWFVIPADDKLNMRLITAQIVLEQLKELKLEFPKLTDNEQAQLQELRNQLI